MKINISISKCIMLMLFLITYRNLYFSKYSWPTLRIESPSIHLRVKWCELNRDILRRNHSMSFNIDYWIEIDNTISKCIILVFFKIIIGIYTFTDLPGPPWKLRGHPSIYGWSFLLILLQKPGRVYNIEENASFDILVWDMFLTVCQVVIQN